MIVASPMMMPGRTRRLAGLDFSLDSVGVEASLVQLLDGIMLKILKELKILCFLLLTLKRVMPFGRI